MSEYDPSEQPSDDETLNLRGRLQIEIAYRALLAAHIEGNTANLLQALLAIDHDAGLKSQPYIALSGGVAGAMRAQILMSLDLMVMSDDTSEGDRVAARELKDILNASGEST
jgi:hypothetical protein